MWNGFGGAVTGSTKPCRQSRTRRSGPEQGFVARRQEEAIRGAARPPPGPAHPLEERGDRRRGVDLDHPVEVADVDAKLQRACGHDHAVLPSGERLLGQTAFLGPERTVRDERLDFLFTQQQGELLHPRPAVAEDQPLLAPVQQPDDLGRIGEGAHEVDLDLGLLPFVRRRLDDLLAVRSEPDESQSSISAGLPTVADKPTRWMSRPASRWMRDRTESRCQPRSSPAKA